MQKRYFGTDGIRGRVNEFPMTAENALKIGMAAGQFFKNNTKTVSYTHLTLPPNREV